MDRLIAARIVRRYAGVPTPTPEERAATDRVCLEEGTPPLAERVSACEAALRKCIDGGKFQWDSVFLALANITEDTLVDDVQYDNGTVQGQEIASSVLRALERSMILIDHRHNDKAEAQKDIWEPKALR